MVSAPIIEEIVWLNFDEATFLWSQRDAAARAVNYSLEDLVTFDERLEAHIDGLRVSGDNAWTICESGLDETEPGTLFATSIIAFESGHKERIAQVIEASNGSREAFRAVVSALGWLEAKNFNTIITGLVGAKSRRSRRLGIAACGIRRVNPRHYLDQAVNSSDLFLKARALKVAGELKRIDLLPQVRSFLQHEDDSCRFEAARSACLLGDMSSLETLSAFILTQSKFTLPAMRVVLRLVDGLTARNWLKTISGKPEQRRCMIAGIGFTGDPAYIPMLLKQLENPELARAAGEAISLITGVNLVAENLAGEQPEGFEAGPNDDPEDDNIEMDLDEDLPWPDANLVNEWWEQRKGNFNVGSRYLDGKPVSPAQCNHVLKHGMQSHRSAAALELALSRADAPWFNTLAPGSWQQKSLAVEA